MRTPDVAPAWLRPFVVAGSIILIVAMLYWAHAILVPVALAILTSFVLAPLVNALQRRGVYRTLAVMLVVAGAVVVFVGISAVITMQLGRLIQELPKHEQNVADKIASIREATRGTFMEKVQELTQNVTKEWTKDADAGTGLLTGDAPLDVRVRTSGFSQALAALGPATEILADAGLVLILVIFMLIQREDLRNRFVTLMGHGRIIPTTRALDEASRLISRFLLSQFLVNAGFGVIFAGGLFCIGVPYAVLWGVCALFLRFIPYVGTLALATVLVAFSFIVFPGWVQPVAVLVLFAVLEIATANFVEPLAFGHSTGISALALLISAAFWAWLWGPIGLILSTPITVCLVVSGRYVPALKFFTTVLGDELEVDKPITYYQRLVARDQDEAAELVEAFQTDHSLEAVFDDLLIPSLIMTNRDEASGQLDDEDVRFAAQVTEQILDDLVEQKAGDDGPIDVEPSPVWVLGYPARGKADELALRMFQQLLAAAGVRFETASSDSFSAELVERVRQEKPAAVFIGALPPGGLLPCRYLCKRLRQQFPDLKILVGVWGTPESKIHLAERVGLPASQVATTLEESRAQLIPIVQVQAAALPREVSV